MTENTTTQSVPTIREAVTEALASKGLNTGEYGNYAPYIDAVIEAVEERETEAKYALREEILEQVGERLDEYAVESAETVLDAVGLEARPTPEPEPEAVTPAEPSEEDRLGRLESTVNRLVALAEHHLGASV